jgi:hypothetical protein
MIYGVDEGTLFVDLEKEHTKLINGGNNDSKYTEEL